MQVLLSPVSRFLSAGAKSFVKEVLREGSYQHPVKPWKSPLEVDGDDLREIAKASNAAIQAGVEVWIPDGHSTRAEDNVGFSREFFVAPSKKVEGAESLYCRMDIVDESYLDKIGTTIRAVSVGLDDYGDEKGNSWGQRVVHVALVPDPVFSGQENFVELSVGGKSQSVPIMRLKERVVKNLKSGLVVPRSLSMTTKVRRLLGVLGVEGAGDVVDADLLSEIADAVGRKLSTPVAPDVKKALSVNGEDPTTKELLSVRGEQVKTSVKNHSEQGRLTKTMAERVEKLLSVRHGFRLSQTGAAEEVDVRAEVEALIAEIPVGAVVPVDERIKALSAAKPPPEKTPEFDADAEVKKRLSALKGAGVKVKV